MEKPMINKQVVYGIVADTMPLEGRDFTLDTAVNNDGKPVMLVTPLTAVGRGFVPSLIERLSSAELGGIKVVAGGTEKQEVETVAKIREKAEREAEETLKKRIEQEREKANNYAKEISAATTANKGREEILRLRSGESSARHNAYVAERSLKLVGSIREAVNEAALAAAKKDAEAGKSWAIDMDAPLNSLFDRQDVTEKMKMKETIIVTAAGKTVELEELKSRATDLAKQYIMPKEG